MRMKEPQTALSTDAMLAALPLPYIRQHERFTTLFAVEAVLAFTDWRYNLCIVNRFCLV